MKSIGFFGDSFCASNQPESWCNILQDKLGADRIRWFGNPGKSIWSVFFQFNKLIEIIKILRSPDGCDWDKEQTHKSLIPYLLDAST